MYICLINHIPNPLHTPGLVQEILVALEKFVDFDFISVIVIGEISEKFCQIECKLKKLSSV